MYIAQNKAVVTFLIGFILTTQNRGTYKTLSPVHADISRASGRVQKYDILYVEHLAGGNDMRQTRHKPPTMNVHMRSICIKMWSFVCVYFAVNLPKERFLNRWKKREKCTYNNNLC